MANKSSQSADWERTNTRAQNAWRKQTKANPPIVTETKNGMYRSMPSAGAQASMDAPRAKMTESRNKIFTLRNDAKKAALKKLSK